MSVFKVHASNFLEFSKVRKVLPNLSLVLFKARVGGYVMILISREIENMRKVS